MSDYYQIENSVFKLQVSSAGAELKRLFAKPWQRELLWVPENEADQKIWNRTSPILFPIVGKLTNDSYHLKGKNYHMSQHGFARDKKFKYLASAPNEMEFLLEADQETFKFYPFCFELRIKYILTEQSLNINYCVSNVDRQDMYFSIGAHPAFETKELENYEISFEQKEKGYYQLSNGPVNWEKLNAINGNTVLPTKELFSNDALIFENLQSRFVELIDRKRQEVIRVNGTNTPYLGVWGKGAVPFVCIEPWYGVSDDFNHDQNLEKKRGIQTLAMGESFNFSYSIEIITRK